MTHSQLLADSISSSRRKPPNFNRRNNEKEVMMDRSLRLWFFRILIVGIFLILVSALLRVQIFEGPYYRDLADGNRIAEIDLPPSRGIIYDRNGNAVVTNLPAFRFKECQADKDNCIAKTISKEQAIDLEVNGLKKGQSLVVDSNRSYPFDKSTAHLLGYVSEVSVEELKDNPNLTIGDKIGRGGIEEQYNSILIGKHGRELVEIDAVGKKLRALSSVPATAGKNINLTIDLSLQKIAYEALGGKKGAVVATNPKTGEVLAIASFPSFDPNVFTELSMDSAERDKQITQLFNDTEQPLFDRAIAGTYPAGSTFKIVTAAAGLESGKISEDYTINDPGILIIGPYRFHNWKFLRDGGTQGILNVVSAMKVSNDIFFYKVGEAVGVDGLSDWALKFGLTRKTGIDLPGEMGGNFPTKEWRTKFSRDWYLGDTYHLAIGQGDMLATPIQVDRWTSIVANGGKFCRPYLLNTNNSKIECRDVGLSKKTLELIKDGMIAACSTGGTAYPLFNFKNPKKPAELIQIACKTGTAEYGDITNEKTHAWLTAFAPANNPTISVTVILEGAGEGSDQATPVVKKVLEEWFSR